ncbi:iron-sulfur cluster assembly protein [Mycobacterium sp.]|uniref:PaaD-like zinc ribbon domain-containing protein n=1 Tax=Mycobacterium sp. TaxID=1785 RepID=UPI003BAA6040
MTPQPVFDAPQDVLDAFSALADPELPFMTIEDMGMLRGVRVIGEAHIEISILPTYGGCPGFWEIEKNIVEKARSLGFGEVTVKRVQDEIWDADQITENGRNKLLDRSIPLETPGVDTPCPHCGSKDMASGSRFGLTLCQSYQVCGSCGEMFSIVKSRGCRR